MGITVFFLDEKVNSVIYEFIPAGRANHYMPSLKAGSIVKLDRFEMWLDKSVLSKALTLAKKQLESLSVSSLIHVVGQIRSVQGSDLSKETTRVVIRLLIDP
ncbi:hypothetical protein F2Q70_00043081 [Brassica cretica]|uniref:Uncharacterized protein n=1 Tax=Brassica cretica TaxID=69181 RepID=A0A8S9KFK8_BRACR|nr:hypothetical protein F2Q70_00043081 [Brassica cretica]